MPVTAGTDRDEWSFEVRSTIPLVDLASVSEVSRTRYQASSAANRAREVRRTVELEVRQLWQELGTARRQLELTSDRVARRRQVAASMEEQYKLGLVSLDTMLDRQRLLTSSEVELEQREVHRLITIYRLLVATGRFSPTVLGGGGN